MSDQHGSDVLERIWFTARLLKDPEYLDDGRSSMECCVAQPDGGDLYVRVMAGPHISRYARERQLRQEDTLFVVGDLHTQRAESNERWVDASLLCSDPAIEGETS